MWGSSGQNCEMQLEGQKNSLSRQGLSEDAAAAESCQSWPTLCDPIDSGPPGSRPWDSPGKNTGVGCHFLLQCMKVKSEIGAKLIPCFTFPWQDVLPFIRGIHRPFQGFWKYLPTFCLSHAWGWNSTDIYRCKDPAIIDGTVPYTRDLSHLKSQ